MPGDRRWPPVRVLTAVRTACGLPDGEVVERDGSITRLVYRDHGLARCLEVYPQPFSAGLLQWQVSVGDDGVRQSPEVTRQEFAKYFPRSDTAE